MMDAGSSLLFAFSFVSFVAVISCLIFYRRRSLERKHQALLDAAKSAAPLAVVPLPLHELIPESRYVEIDGAKFHYVQAGEGCDVVLLHGIGASVFIWRFLFPLLQTRHRVTAIDLPGFGKSSKDLKRKYDLDSQTELVRKLLAKIGVEKPLLVGSSMGGAIALWLARRFPDEFSRVIGLAPATDSSLIPPSAQLFALAAPLLRRALNRRSMKGILGRVLSKRSLITDQVVDAYLEPFQGGADGVRTFWAALSLLADKRLPKGLSGLSARVLVIYGERDLLVPRRSITRLMEILPEAVLITNADGGHHIMEDEPEWTARLIEEFLAQWPGKKPEKMAEKKPEKK